MKKIKKYITLILLGLLSSTFVYGQNNVMIEQEGARNDVQLEFIEASGNTLAITQRGNDNRAEAFVIYESGLNYLLVQQGRANTALLDAEGEQGTVEGNSVYLEQLGTSNYARQAIQGRDNLSEIIQYGNHNEAITGGIGSYQNQLLQWGNKNTYQLSVFGGLLQAEGVQIGHANFVEKRADASLRYESYQYGNGNRALMSSQAINLISITQLGVNNEANQGGGGSGNSPILLLGYQSGRDNYLRQNVGLVGAELRATQWGVGNYAEQTSIYGNDEVNIWGAVEQQGRNNSATAYTDGSNYRYSISQHGKGNEANLSYSRLGDQLFSEATIGQYGNYNSALVEQRSSREIHLIQSGNHNSAVIMEH